MFHSRVCSGRKHYATRSAWHWAVPERIWALLAPPRLESGPSRILVTTDIKITIPKNIYDEPRIRNGRIQKFSQNIISSMLLVDAQRWWILHLGPIELRWHIDQWHEQNPIYIPAQIQTLCGDQHYQLNDIVFPHAATLRPILTKEMFQCNAQTCMRIKLWTDSVSKWSGWIDRFTEQRQTPLMSNGVTGFEVFGGDRIGR